MSGVWESNPPSQLGRLVPKADRPTPRNWQGWRDLHSRRKVLETCMLLLQHTDAWSVRMDSNHRRHNAKRFTGAPLCRSGHSRIVTYWKRR